MLKLGSSREWTYALEAITGNRTMSAQPLIEYFQPLMQWLTDYNEEHGQASDGWEDFCPPDTELPEVC